MKSYNLRKEAVPDDTLSLAKFEYCALARALCTAAVSTADILLKPAVLRNKEQLVKNQIFENVRNDLEEVDLYEQLGFHFYYDY